MEEFRDIKEYEGLYQVSNLGRVKSLNYNHTKKEKILNPHKENSGYLRIHLSKERKVKAILVHRLVAEAFIDNPHNYPIINHKDENKENNNVNNLEWCDYKYNLNYGTVQKRKVENTDYKKKVENTDYNKISDKLLNREDQSKKVYQYTKDGEFVREWSSTAEAGRNGYNSSSVSNACVGRLKTYKGFIWTYDKNYIHKEITYDNRKPVLQFTLNGEFVKEWATAAEAERNGFNHICISMCCNGKRKTHNGYIWSYDKNYIHKEIVYKRHLKPVLQFTKDGEFVREWKSINECEINGYQHGSIIKCCKCKQKTHKGFIWKYK